MLTFAGIDGDLVNSRAVQRQTQLTSSLSLTYKPTLTWGRSPLARITHDSNALVFVGTY